MMSSVASKTTLGIVSVGGIVGGGVLVHNYLFSDFVEDNRSTVGELISNSKTKIAVKGASEWNALWIKYKADNKNKVAGQDDWRLDEWKGPNNPENIPDSYKEKCIALSGEKVDGEHELKYLEFLNRCARDKNVGDLLRGFSLLPTGGEHEAKWKKRFEKYKAAKQGNKFPIADLVLGDSDSSSTADHLNKLKNGCSSQWSKSVNGDEEQEYLDSVKDWCSLEETKNDK